MSKLGKNEPAVVYRLGHLGDVALTTGVLAYLHEKHGHSFVFVTRKGNAPLLEGHPAIREVIGLEDRTLKTGAWLKESGRLAELYKNSTLLDLHDTLRSRILSLRWKGPVHRYPKFSLTRRLFDQFKMDRHRLALEATNVPQRYAMAVEDEPPMRADLLPRIFLSDKEKKTANGLLTGMSNGRPLICLHPYATHPAKQWPREHWQRLTGLLAGANMDWFIVGRDDAPLYPDHERDLTNRTNLRETCALMAKADMVVTGDSGPMHLACGVNTPVIAFFGPTVRSWGFQPAGEDDIVLERDMDCRPCSLHGAKSCTRGFECMTSITPEEVMEHILDSIPC